MNLRMGKLSVEMNQKDTIELILLLMVIIGTILIWPIVFLIVIILIKRYKRLTVQQNLPSDTCDKEPASSSSDTDR